jgi:D-tyrosyl-tRNA(Tyr) deacylase
MIALIQRVSRAQVTVDGVVVGKIGRGVLALVCAERNDTEAEAAGLVAKLLGYRIFPDEHGRMNRCLVDIEGGLLLVPQFTRPTPTAGPPSFAMPPDRRAAVREFVRVAAGVMPTATACSSAWRLTNDGPVTFQAAGAAAG